MRSPGRGSVLLALCAAAAFLVFVALGGEERRERAASGAAPLSSPEGSAAPVTSSGGADASTTAKRTRPDNVADVGRERSGEPAGEGEGTAAGADAPAGEIAAGSWRDRLAASLGRWRGASPPATAGGTPSAGTVVEGAPATRAGGSAAEDAAKPLPGCDKPIITKAVFNLEFQPEMRSAFDAAYRLAATGGRYGSTFSTGSGDAYVLNSSDKGSMEAGGIFNSSTLVILRGKCLDDASQLKAALRP